VRQAGSIDDSMRENLYFAVALIGDFPMGKAGPDRIKEADKARFREIFASVTIAHGSNVEI